MIRARFSTRLSGVLALGALALCAAALLGLGSGSSGLALPDLWRAIVGTASDAATAIFWQLRLPRVILAAHAGAVLSLGGLVFQAVLRNPLAEPYILGVSGGAAVGTIIGILLGLSPFFLSGATFTGGLAVLGLISALGLSRGGAHSLLLSGVMVNAFCSAIILFLLSQARGSEISTIMYWFMGDLGSGTLRQAGVLTLCLIPGYALLLALSHRMNLLLLGEDAARSMGVNVQRLVATLLIAVSMMVSGTVTVIGPLGFVGLVVPQALRIVLGADHRLLAPACCLFGAAYMIACDMLARICSSQGELPAGVITALIGAPIFVLLLRRKG